MITITIPVQYMHMVMIHACIIISQPDIRTKSITYVKLAEVDTLGPSDEHGEHTMLALKVAYLEYYILALLDDVMTQPQHRTRRERPPCYKHSSNLSVQVMSFTSGSITMIKGQRPM